jgi:hypothetical protein
MREIEEKKNSKNRTDKFTRQWHWSIRLIIVGSYLD